MNNFANGPKIGDFTIFGITRSPNMLLRDRLTEQLGIMPQEIDFGAQGKLFFHTTYGEVAESDNAFAIKLGFLRAPDKSPVSANQILNKKIIGPEFINNDLAGGNGLIIYLGKKAMVFSAFKTILGVPQLYYSILENGIVCSDRLAVLVNLLGKIELNEDAVPMHFLFRSMPGDITYYQNIRRMLPGQFINWHNGILKSRMIEDFNYGNSSNQFSSDKNLADSISQTLTRVIGDYLRQIEYSGYKTATLLSGGVDSSLVQFLINQKISYTPARSFSFAVQSPDFNHEIEYARQASHVFHTDHTFVYFTSGDYPGLLTRTIELLAQPPILQTEPSMLSIAEYVHQNDLPDRYFFSGQGADTVFGLTIDKKLKGLNLIKGIPGITYLLHGCGILVKPINSLSTMLIKGSAILESADNPEAFLSPSNSIANYCNLDLLRRCFGDEVLRKALRYRREFALQYTKTDHYLEKVHLIDLMTDTYELGVQRQQLFLAYKREQLHPFFDDDTLCAAFAIPPDRRYIKGFRPKYLLKDILDQQTQSAVSRKPKGFSVFEDDLNTWMKSGPLRDLIEEIELPGFMNRADFNQLKEKPDFFLWGLLTFHIFKSRWLK